MAILAARQGTKVYAIDHSDFIHVAEQIAKHNGIDNIQFLKMNSREFTCPEKADYILHEQIGDDLFDENMIVNLLDLKQRALKDNGVIFPGRFELFLEPVALKNDYPVPFIWETPVHAPHHTQTSWGNRMLRCAHHDYAVGETISFQVEMGDIRFADTWSCTFNH